MSAQPLPESVAAMKSTRHGMLQYIVGNCGALFAGLAVAYFGLLRGGHITNLTIRTGDFIQYFSVSRLILRGHGGAIYDPNALSHVEALLVYPLSMQHGVLPYLYPPYFAVVVGPLSALPYGGAYLLWLVLNCLLLVLTLFALESYGRLTGRGAALVRLAGICSLPVVMTLALGQVSIVICALLVLCFFAARSGHDGIAGAALALALIKPPYVLPLLVIFVVQRRWKLLSAFAGTCALLLAVPIPVLGVSINQTYGQLLAAATGWQGQAGGVFYHHVMIAGATYDPHINQSFAGFAQLILSAPASMLLTVSLSVLILALLVRCAWLSPDLDLPFGLAVVTALLINPHVLVHDLTLLLLPIWIVLRHAREGIPHAGWLLALCYLLITAGYPLSYVVHLQLSVVAMAALGIWMVMTANRIYSSDERASPALRGGVRVPGHSS